MLGAGGTGERKRRLDELKRVLRDLRASRARTKPPDATESVETDEREEGGSVPEIQETKDREETIEDEKIQIKKKYRDSELRGLACIGTEYSPVDHKVFAAGYKSMREDKNQSKDKVVVWNIDLEHEPLVTFRSDSELSSFGIINNDMVVCANKLGMIAVHDGRVGPNAVLKNELFMNRHVSHVHTIKNIPIKSKSKILTASVDGEVRIWDLKNLRMPEKLHIFNHIKKRFISGTTLLDNDIHDTSEILNILHCSSSGDILKCQLRDTNYNNSAAYVGHSHFVSNIHPHPISHTSLYPFTSYSQKDLLLISNLVLSSSLDWSVRLWNLNSLSSTSSDHTSPLFSFEHWVGPIHDVKWSTVHPSVFAVAAPNSFIFLFDLAINAQLPISSFSPLSNSPVVSLSWSPLGDSILSSHSDGSIILSPLSDPSFSTPPPDAISNLALVARSYDNIV